MKLKRLVSLTSHPLKLIKHLTKSKKIDIKQFLNMHLMVPINIALLIIDDKVITWWELENQYKPIKYVNIIPVSCDWL